MNKDFLAREIERADGLIKQLGTLTYFDVQQLFFTAYGRKDFRFEVKKAIVEHLNANYDSIIESERVWYFKKLKTCTCLFCGCEFKATDKHQRFCCLGHKRFYLNKKEHELILPI